MDDYFDPVGSARAVLMWAVATRVQLGHWESLSAARLAQEVYKIPSPTADYWHGEYKRRFCLVAARNLFRALDLLDPPLPVDKVLRDEIHETRDLNEHWEENMPVFNIHPMPKPPGRQSGRAFAARNGTRGPYCWWAWNGNDGPLLTPNVPATALHELIDRVEARLLSEYPDLEDFVPPRSPSGWFNHHDGWWPVPDADQLPAS